VNGHSTAFVKNSELGRVSQKMDDLVRKQQYRILNDRRLHYEEKLEKSKREAMLKSSYLHEMGSNPMPLTNSWQMTLKTDEDNQNDYKTVVKVKRRSSQGETTATVEKVLGQPNRTHRRLQSANKTKTPLLQSIQAQSGNSKSKDRLKVKGERPTSQLEAPSSDAVRSVVSSPKQARAEAKQKKKDKKYVAALERRLQATVKVREDKVTRYATKEVKSRLEAHERRKLFKAAKEQKKRAAELDDLRSKPTAFEKLQKIKRAQSSYKSR
jgi:hypothetical protein